MCNEAKRSLIKSRSGRSRLRRSRLGPASNARGFTLLEVTIAVAIAGLALVTMFQAGSTGLFAVNSAARIDEAVERAQSHLAAFGSSDAIVPGDSEGDDGGGYHWRLSARPLLAETPSPDDQNAPMTTLYAVESAISWNSWGGTRSVVLYSRRLGAPAARE
jgi:general secretion pathway protein I